MNDTPNFFDRRTLTAILLVMITWLGWQYYLQKKYPDLYTRKQTQEHSGTSVPDTKPEPKSQDLPPAKPQMAPLEPTDLVRIQSESYSEFVSPQLTFSISSKGMGLKDIKLPSYRSRNGEIVDFPQAVSPRSFETRLIGSNEPIDFKIEKTSDTTFIGNAKVGDVEVTKTLTVDPAKYALDVRIVTKGQDAKFVGLTTYVVEELEPYSPKGFLSGGSAETQNAFVDASESHKNYINFEAEPVDKTWTGGHVVALGSHYFTKAIADHSPISPEIKLKSDPSKHLAVAELVHSNANKADTMNVNLLGFVGPKSLSVLREADDGFTNVVDFGRFAFIARYILEMLKGFFAIAGNWGVAIILLTILVRLLVLPFNIISYKSMKAMQKLQPEINALRERYKDDQQRLQQEMMNLYRTQKVNPLGGCLPVLIQLPIFLALYQVLGHSIELYQAPFALWINDLSLKDPFYVLPVLMGITMFLQQKITPNTLDPAQARILQFMPIMFAFFMISLPSGLTLYIWVSALFAVVQQYYFVKAHA